MKITQVWILLSGAVLTPPALAQRVEPVNSLARARATFDATDANKDGRLSFDELIANKLPIQKADFDLQDVDKDGLWSREEFLVYYRRLLLSSGERAADDLESEVTRIQALRKAKQADAGTKTPQPTSAVHTARNPGRVTVTSTTNGGPAAAAVDARLEQAIEELEKKAAARQATREDFQRVRDGMIERAKLAGSADPKGAEDLQARFETALQALEVQAKDGKYSRAEFNTLRDLLIRRGREAAKGADAAAGQTPPVDAPIDIEARLQRAVDDLEKKAAARQATREDFNRVRDVYMARARAAMGPGDAAQAKEQGTIVGRLTQAIDALEQKALAGQYSREEFTQLRDAMFAKARAAVSGGAPQPGASPPAPPVVKPPEKDAIETRFDEALGDLEKKAAARQATREDFNRVREMLIARARAAVKDANAPTAKGEAEDPAISALAAKMQSALDRLEQQAKDGKISPEDFAQIHQMIVHRARGAAASIESNSGSQNAVDPAGARKRELEGKKAPDGANPAPAPATPPNSARSNGTKPAEDAGRASKREEAPPTPAPPPQDPPKVEKPQRGSTPPPTPPASDPPHPAPPATGGGRGDGGGGS